MRLVDILTSSRDPSSYILFPALPAFGFPLPPVFVVGVGVAVGLSLVWALTCID